MENFQRARPRDHNVLAVVGTPREALFYRFHEEALNTLSPVRAQRLQADGWRLAGTQVVRIRSLDEILARASISAPIDLLAIDVEGADLDVLQSVNLSRWGVKRVLIETGANVEDLDLHPITKYLRERGLSPSVVWRRSVLFESVETDAHP